MHERCDIAHEPIKRLDDSIFHTFYRNAAGAGDIRRAFELTWLNMNPFRRSSRSKGGDSNPFQSVVGQIQLLHTHKSARYLHRKRRA